MTDKTTVDGLWIAQIPEGYKIGLTKQMQEELGEITFALFPKAGQKLVKGESLIEVEAEKAVNEFLMPLTGTILAINESAEATPHLLNDENPLKAWIAIVHECVE